MKAIHNSGKRKCAVAKATLIEGDGKITINKGNLDNYQPKISRMKIREPLILAGDIAHKVDIEITVSGGGVNGQTEAARLALSKCLAQHNKKLEKYFLNYDRHLLVGDVRRKEPCKPNKSKARKKRQKSYR